MTPQREVERVAFNRLMKAIGELASEGKLDRHSDAFKTKTGTVAEAIEIWRAAEFAAQHITRAVA